MNRIVAAVAGVIAVVVVIVLVVVFVTRGGDEEGAGDPNASLPAISAISIVTADAVVLPIQNTELSMPNSGIMDEILVQENQTIRQGEPLARLERDKEIASVAKAEADLANAVARLETLKANIAKEVEDEDEARPLDLEKARIDVRDAREELLHVSGANLRSGASVSPEGAIKEAERAKAIADTRDAVEEAQLALLDALGVSSNSDISESPESIFNKVARDIAIADAGIAVLDAEEELENAEDFAEILKDEVDAVSTAMKNLESARRDVIAAQANSREKIRNAKEDFQDATEDLRDIYKKWLGIELTSEEFGQTPEELLALWEVDLDRLFDRSNLTYSGGISPDVSVTRWNELTVYAWLFLRPDNSSIAATCEETLGATTSQLCITREMDDTWEAYESAQDALDGAETDGPSSIARAENAVISAEQALQDAEEDLDQQQTDRPALDAAVALANLETAEATLADLRDFPDAIEVALAEAQLADAEAALEDLLDWPDELLVAVAEEELAKAELELGKLERGREPLDEARRGAEIQEAEAQVTSAEANLELARIGLADMELRAPFTGTVIAVEVDLGEEVATDTVVVRLADISRWQIETDDLDELSVVNLREGDTVTVSFDALPDVQIQGTVEKISQFGEEKQGAITYTAEINLNEFDDRLRWNMTASIRKESDGG